MHQPNGHGDLGMIFSVPMSGNLEICQEFYMFGNKQNQQFTLVFPVINSQF